MIVLFTLREERNVPVAYLRLGNTVQRVTHPGTGLISHGQVVESFVNSILEVFPGALYIDEKLFQSRFGFAV